MITGVLLIAGLVVVLMIVAVLRTAAEEGFNKAATKIGGLAEDKRRRELLGDSQDETSTRPDRDEV